MLRVYCTFSQYITYSIRRLNNRRKSIVFNLNALTRIDMVNWVVAGGLPFPSSSNDGCFSRSISLSLPQHKKISGLSSFQPRYYSTRPPSLTKIPPEQS